MTLSDVLSKVAGGPEWERRLAQQHDLTKVLFRDARLSNETHFGKHIWVSAEGKKFAVEGEYPDLEPVAEELRDYFETEHGLGNYDQYIPKKYQATPAKVKYSVGGKRKGSKKSVANAGIGGVR